MKALLLSLVLGLWAACAQAHKPSDSYLSLKVEGDSVQGRWDIALRDLDYAIGLDANDDGAITWPIFTLPAVFFAAFWWAPYCKSLKK